MEKMKAELSSAVKKISAAIEAVENYEHLLKMDGRKKPDVACYRAIAVDAISAAIELLLGLDACAVRWAAHERRASQAGGRK